MTETAFPKIVWSLWLQGEENAPFIVKHCIASWRRENPDWKVIVLDKSTIYDYISIDMPREKFDSMSPVEQSDLIRLLLLEKFGGVWTDATVYCMKALNEWIYEYVKAGFFVFDRPGPDRLISNWLIASNKNNPICTELRVRFQSFFSENTFKPETRLRSVLLRKFSQLLNQSTKTTKYWFNPFFTKFLGIYPYSIFHYMFERIIASNDALKEIWNDMPKMSASPPHNIQNAGELGMLSPINQTLKLQIDNCELPVYKLRWKYDTSADISNTALEYLVEGRFAAG